MNFKQKLLLLTLALPLHSCTGMTSPLAHSRKATVSYIYDGDTIQVGKDRIRLLGINTPEMERKKHGRKAECYSQEAKDFLNKTILYQEIVLKSDRKAKKRDRFGRILAWVYFKGRLLNQEIVEKGYGFAFRKFPNAKSKKLIRSEERAADNKLGLWSACKVDCSRGYCRIDSGIKTLKR